MLQSCSSVCFFVSYSELSGKGFCRCARRERCTISCWLNTELRIAKVQDEIQQDPCSMSKITKITERCGQVNKDAGTLTEQCSSSQFYMRIIVILFLQLSIFIDRDISRAKGRSFKRIFYVILIDILVSFVTWDSNTKFVDRIIRIIETRRENLSRWQW